MEKKHWWYLLGGGGLLLWLLTRGKSGAACQHPNVMQWIELLRKKRRRLTPAAILAVIHDQSQGNPGQVYYVGRLWPRYGLMGVPLAWAQELGFTGRPEELLDPEINIDWGEKILYYMDSLIIQAYATGGVRAPFEPGMSANAYSWYKNGQQLTITDVRDPVLHHTMTIKRIMDLLTCYRQIAD